MNGVKVSDKVSDEELVAAYLDRETFPSLREIALYFDLSENTIRQRIRDLRLRGSVGMRDDPDSADAQVEVFDKHLRLEGDWAVCSDIHAPYHDREMIGRLFQVSRKLRIPNLLCAGDTWDQYVFSRFDPRAEDAGREIRVLRFLLEDFLIEFERVVLLMGNHEQRLIRKLERRLGIEDMWKLVCPHPGLVISEYPYAIINGKWWVTHPSSFSTVTLRVSHRLASKHRMCVIAAHGHHIGWGLDQSGRDVVCDIGAMADPDRVEYVKKKDTIHPMWAQGFCVVKNNHLHLFSKHHTDWSFWNDVLTA